MFRIWNKRFNCTLRDLYKKRIYFDFKSDFRIKVRRINARRFRTSSRRQCARPSLEQTEREKSEKKKKDIGWGPLNVSGQRPRSCGSTCTFTYRVLTPGGRFAANDEPKRPSGSSRPRRLRANYGADDDEEKKMDGFALGRVGCSVLFWKVYNIV